MFRPVALFLLNLALSSAFDARRVVPPVGENGMRSIVYFLDGVRDTVPPGTCSWRTRSLNLDKDDPVEWWAFFMESSGFGLAGLGARNASRSYLDFDFSDCTEDLAIAVYNNSGLAPTNFTQDRDSGPFNSPQLSFGLGAGDPMVPNSRTRPPTCVKRNGHRSCGEPYNGQGGDLAPSTRYYLAIVVQKDNTQFLSRFTPARYGYGRNKGKVSCNYRFRYCAFDPRQPDNDDEENGDKNKNKKNSKKNSKKNKRDRELFEDVRNL